jgi:hypothetical protein
MTFVPCLVRSMDGSELVTVSLGHPLVDGYLEFVGARGAVNTWLAVAYDLKVFFEVIGKEPADVTAADVFAFLAVQRAPRHGERVVRIEDGEPGLAARTIARRLSSVGVCSSICSRVVMRESRATLCRVGWRVAAPVVVAAAGCGSCVPRGRCRVCCRPPRSTGCFAPCARGVIERWCWRCCSAGCVAVRCSGCGVVM